jgi:mevalonate pyrophosphate decarboxylase
MSAFKFGAIQKRSLSMNHHHYHEDIDPEDHDSLSKKEKLVKLFQYWMKHNEDHAKTYREWSKKADIEGLKDVVSLLEEASELTMSINSLFKEAIKKLL